MFKVKENELKTILKKFDNCPIKIVFNGVLKGKFEFNNCKIKYVNSRGKIEIREKDIQNILIIDTFLAYKILIDNKFTILELYMDYDLIIKIEKI